MTEPRRIVALLVAAGSGSRAGGTVPKQFALLAGRPMLAHAHAALAGHPDVDEVIVVVAAGEEPRLADALGAVPSVIGGATRRESVAAGLVAATRAGATHVLIHDAARPWLPRCVIDRLVSALDDHEAATPVLPVADTLVRSVDNTLSDVVDRASLVRVQTPQAFRLATLSTSATDDAQMVRRLGVSVALVQGDPVLEKITHPGDFAAASARIGHEYRTATGFDVHRLEAGEELWLGGVLIPHDKGLSGHSDADVALHALTDALLGTIAAGDIGTHFPPSDPQWRGAESGQFLRHAASLVTARGGEVTFVDLTILCEAPKIGPHRAAMVARIADLLGLSPDRVSVKATTTERLGFTGRGEGIAAQAAATVRLPVVPVA
jgi:2-C-methyl-D-erythritol 4-phosphate cytidylyltransferase/2-C-methyl-D-erythritol 2,4-cyclodiphosphate synthase